ncbi:MULTISPECIES: phosphotransferase enzyme family protein [Aphanothece]|uniref:phosphotransferase enzyme family protein n=1 Tax=Aphanothece TaxID=1121 RepID=UPI003984F6DC
MHSPSLAGLAERFAIAGPVATVAPLGNGNVNETFLVTTEPGERYVLQRINTEVFHQPALVMGNIAALASHIAAGGANAAAGPADWQLPRAVPLADRAAAPAPGNWLELNGQAWRLLTHVSGATSFDTIQDGTHAAEVGRALGVFHRLIHDLPTAELADTLEGFHITPRYLADYRRSLAASRVARCDEAEHCIAFVAARESLASVLEDARARGELQPRPIHGDPKVNNVMVDSSSGRAVALVDLDTVKPGLVHYDIGDCLRSGCNRAGEDAGDLSAVHFDLGLGRQILGAYLNEARGFLTAADFDHLYDAIRLIAFELGLRFFSDHLAGNRYFRCRHPRHNLARALVQFRLTESIEAQEPALRALIEELR